MALTWHDVFLSDKLSSLISYNVNKGYYSFYLAAASWSVLAECHVTEDETHALGGDFCSLKIALASYGV